MLIGMIMIELSLLLKILASVGGASIVAMLLFAQKRINAANRMLHDANDRLKNTKRDIDNERREAFLKIKDEIYRKRNEFELEMKRERLELDRLQSKLNGKYEILEKKEQNLDEMRRESQQKERNLSRIEDTLRASEIKLKNLYNDLLAKLERVATMTRDEAKQALFDTLESEVKLSSQKWIQKVEEEARQTAKEKSVRTVVTAMQRYTADQVAPHSSGVVHLPNEEMKGRIIGKEGRNIKSLEISTGMEFIIGDSQDITISGFNPIRRAISSIRVGLM